MEGEIPTYFPFLSHVTQYGPLRLQGLLNSDERQAALSKEGVPVAALRPELQEEAFRASVVEGRIPTNQNRLDALRARLATSRLFLSPPPPNVRIPVPMTLQIIAAPP